MKIEAHISLGTKLGLTVNGKSQTLKFQYHD